MFTGLISNLGLVRDVVTAGGFLRVRIVCSEWQKVPLDLGESIAVNGCCLTVISSDSEAFVVELSPETMRLTTLGLSRPGMVVNLERSLLATSRLGGHFVTGHVDAVGVMKKMAAVGDGLDLHIAVPDTLQKYIAVKGSIAVDGVSLTVNAVDAEGFDVMIIPHTRRQTIIGNYKPGVAVNVEVDLLARYVERRLSIVSDDKGSGLTREWLAARGYD